MLIAVLGAGPGLGMSIARRWAAAGYAVALVSRSPVRHESYLAALPGSDHRAYAADVTDPSSLTAVLERIGPVDAAYFGPAAIGAIVPLPSATAEDLRRPIEQMLMPLATLVSIVLPGMLSRAPARSSYRPGSADCGRCRCSDPSRRRPPPCGCTR